MTGYANGSLFVFENAASECPLCYQIQMREGEIRPASRLDEDLIMVAGGYGCIVVRVRNWRLCSAAILSDVRMGFGGSEGFFALTSVSLSL